MNLRNWLARYNSISLPFLVVGYLTAGMTLGYFFPENPVMAALHTSGTLFPKTIVTFAALLIFNLLAGAMAKLILFHKERAGKLFGLIFGVYVTMGFISLIYVTCWIPFLTDTPFALPGQEVPSAGAWLAQIGNTFANVLTDQPLMQALVGSLALGWATAKFEKLHPVAHGFIKVGDKILLIFKKLMWYYPIMIGCLAMGIPLKFGSKGLIIYGQTVLWVMLVICSWCILMILFCRYGTKRTWKQIFSYYGTVWFAGFGICGSYDTLAVNIISAERDLGLREDIAEISIVFGTVLNKNCSTMAVILTAIAVSKLLGLPISLSEILLLIPPVMILGLESPGVPGGAAYFMSPIIAVLLNVPDTAVYVSTFVAVFSGLIPMFNSAGNTTDDGVVGCILQDRFGHWIDGQSPARSHTKEEFA